MIGNLPGHLLAAVDSLPHDATAALLLRHAEREAIVDGDDGVDADLTSLGYERSFAFGKYLSHRLLWANSSPLLRAKRTVEQITKGAGINELVVSNDSFLGNPGPFVFDSVKGAKLFGTIGTKGLVRRLAAGECFDGMYSAKEGARNFVGHLHDLSKYKNGLGIMVSHDAILIPMLAVWTGEFFQNDWLEPLDGALIVLNKNKLYIYRNDKVKELF